MGSRARACALLVIVGLVPVGSAMADTGPSLAGAAAPARHPITPDIYGWNFVPADVGQQIGVTVDRRGGNSADTLNWQTGVENHSNDYFFENLPSCWLDCPVDWDPAPSYTDQIDADQQISAKTVVDVPMLGRVPRSFPNNNSVFCSFSVAKYGAQTAVDPYDTDCGSGLANPGGGAIVNNPDDSGVAVTPAFQGNWVADLVS